MKKFSEEGCTQDEEFVEIWLRNSPENNKTVTLNGRDAEKAREEVGGTWAQEMPVNVLFSEAGQPCQVRKRGPVSA